MSTKPPLTRRRGAVAREEALEAARGLLLSGGPGAVTLKAVGQAMGVGHANLIHHFGSAAGLQGALMDRMVRDLAARVSAQMDETLPGGDPGRLMAAVFEAFGEGGAAQVAAWLALAHETRRAESFAEVVRDLADRAADSRGGGEAARRTARAIVVVATYMAFADALIGPALTPMLDLPRETPRELALQAALALLARDAD